MLSDFVAGEAATLLQEGTKHSQVQSFEPTLNPQTLTKHLRSSSLNKETSWAKMTQISAPILQSSAPSETGLLCNMISMSFLFTEIKKKRRPGLKGV